VILYGPSGVGKPTSRKHWGTWQFATAPTSLRQTSRILANLAGGRADGTWGRRLRELARPPVLILHDFGLRELTARQADDLYELISERAGRSLELTSSRSPIDWYPPFLHVVAESLLMSTRMVSYTFPMRSRNSSMPSMVGASVSSGSGA
jgi:hypothetical protein